MVVDDPRTRNALEAVAFGRVTTPEDEAAAARALKALRELDDRASTARARAAGIPAVTAPGVGGARRAAAAGTGAASGPIMVEVVDDSQAISHDTWGVGPNRVTETLRRLWVVPVVVASIALGAVGGSVATRSAEKPPVSLAPVAQATVRPDSGELSAAAAAAAGAVAAQPQGDSVVDPVVRNASADAAAIASAEAWLNEAQRSVDAFPAADTLKAFRIDPNSTHLVTTEGTMGLWVARGVDGSLCLVMMTTASESSAVSACIPPAQFPIDGISLNTADGASAHWLTSGIDWGYGSAAGSTG
jgi:hypothetical protein